MEAEELADGTRPVLDMEEWINKPSGRGSITLGADNEDGEEPTPLASWGVFLGFASYAEVVPQMFAWADVDVHEETYDEADHEQYETECRSTTKAPSSSPRTMPRGAAGGG